MPDFPHLPLPKKVSAKHKAPKRRFEKIISPETENNLTHRVQHGRGLRNSVTQLIDNWDNQLRERESDELPALPNSNIIPIFLQIDSKDFDAEQLYSFGIEVIAEEDGGFIIGASSDNFISLKQKIAKFIKEDGKFKNTAARLWNIIQGNQWRVDYILSDELKAKWDSIEEDEVFIVDISVACYIKISATPFEEQLKT